MERMKGMRAPFYLALFLVLTVWAFKAEAGVPVVSDTMVTDVTTRSFSVIWKSSEASAAGLNVFNADCVTPTAGALITPHPLLGNDPTIKATAENKGIMKVQVTSLQAATQYCFQTVTTSKSTSDVTTYTPLASDRTVVTETLTVRTYVDAGTGAIMPFANDLLVFPIYEPDQVTFAAGSLLLISGTTGVEPSGVGYPVTAFVGDGVASPLALVDLNNLFDASTHENLDVFGGNVLILREFRGDGAGLGSATLVRYRKAPLDVALAEIKDPVQCFFADNNCSDGVNIIDVQRGLNLFDSMIGDNDFNSDMNVVVDNTINILDIQGILNRLDETAPFTP